MATRPFTEITPPQPVSSLELEYTRSHLTDTRVAIIRRLDEGYDPAGLHIKVLEKLAESLERQLAEAEQCAFVHNGITYSDFAGRA